ncbi:hypothetical protein K435DRAFT_969857 [Dendrothele bispora CBS 962.96]|uniref:Uncharacterized protein n=1 Tax=Dendrothele bispora (strain CBS 962.96) TaxID=1314807 RepID=A0A4S8LF26_DENBC|nr:hypothetical protein K435DRAFT_969857 [Dendrothele bispora CBS 962.96]
MLFTSKVGLLTMTTLATLASVVNAQNNHVWIRSLASSPIEAMVSIFSTGGGNDAWFTLPANYDDPNQSEWHRTGWELVAFRNKTATNERVGFYKDFNATDTFVTFYSFDYVTFDLTNPEA